MINILGTSRLTKKLEGTMTEVQEALARYVTSAVFRSLQALHGTGVAFYDNDQYVL